MRQVKLFKGLEADIKDLESEVNEWIRQNNVRVARITGNIAPQSERTDGKTRFSSSDILIIVEFETSGKTA